MHIRTTLYKKSFIQDNSYTSHRTYLFVERLFCLLETLLMVKVKRLMNIFCFGRMQHLSAFELEIQQLEYLEHYLENLHMIHPLVD